MIKLILISIIFVTLGCATSKNSLNKDFDPILLVHEDAYLTGELDSLYERSQPTIIDSLEIDYIKNTLQVWVTFSGGCEHHDFELAGSMAIMKSLPPKRHVRILNFGKPDLCRGVVNKKMIFNIAPIVQDYQDVGIELIFDETSILYQKD